MQEDQYSRTRMLLGQQGLQRLRAARVAVFGVGGVGGYAVEALARCGVGTLDIVDNDTVSLSNLNRQLLATHSTLGQYKVDVARARIADIDPTLTVNAHRLFFTPQNAAAFDFAAFDYVVDAIDTVAGKLALVQQAFAAGVPVISCMGAGNKLDAGAFTIADISRTSVCPLARVMRRELKKRGILHLKVVYSTEPPLCAAPEQAIWEAPFGEVPPAPPGAAPAARRSTPGSVSFVPAVAGLLLAGEVVRDLLRTGGEQNK